MNLIGCTPLPAVAGIPKNQPGQCGCGLGTQSASGS